MIEAAQGAAVFDEYEAAKALLAKWAASDPRGTPTEIALRDEKLANAQQNFDAIEAKFRTLRGDFGELPRAAPPPLPAASDATVAVKPVSDASAHNDSNRGPVLKRAAMVKKLEGVWHSISSDLQHSDKNGLAKAAKAAEHGNWYEDDALRWARQRGKVNEQQANKIPANSMFNLTGVKHLVDD